MASARVTLCLERKLVYRTPGALGWRPLAKTHPEAGCGGPSGTWETKVGELPETPR